MCASTVGSSTPYATYASAIIGNEIVEIGGEVLSNIIIDGTFDIDNVTITFKNIQIDGGTVLNITNSNIRFEGCSMDVGTIQFLIDESSIVYFDDTRLTSNEVVIQNGSIGLFINTSQISTVSLGIKVLGSSGINASNTIFDEAPILLEDADEGGATVYPSGITHTCTLKNTVFSPAVTINAGYYFGQNNTYHDNSSFAIKSNNADLDPLIVKEFGSNFDANTAGIEIDNAQQVLIHYCDFQDQPDFDVLLTSGWGPSDIHDCTFDGSEKQFDGSIWIADYTDMSIDRNDFENYDANLGGLGDPIRAVVSLVNVSFSHLEENDISLIANRTGFYANDCSQVSYEACSVVTGAAGLLQYGFQIVASEEMRFYQNLVDAPVKSAFELQYSPGSQLCDNTFKHGPFGSNGLDVDGDCDPSSFTDNHFFVDILRRGIVYREDALVGAQLNNGNDFTGPPYQIYAEYENVFSPLLINFNRYEVLPNQSPTEWPWIIPVSWFQPGTTSVECLLKPYETPPNLVDPEDPDGIWNFRLSEVLDPDTTGSDYLTMSHGLHLIRKYPELNSPLIAGNFCLQLCDTDFDSIFNRFEIREFRDSLEWMLIEQLADSNVTPASLQAQQTILGEVSASMNILIDDYRTKLKQAKDVSIQQQTQEFAGLYEKSIGLYIDHLDSVELSSFDLAFIETVANYCLTDYGPAVLVTRSLADRYGIFFNDHNCIDERNDSQKKNVELLIYPNPARDFIQFIFHDKSEVNFSIYDVSGKRFIESSSKDNIIDISMLPSGLYLLKTSRGTSKFVKL